MARHVVSLLLIGVVAIAYGGSASAAPSPLGPPDSGVPSPPPASPPVDIAVELGVLFDLELGRSAVIEDTSRLRFDSIIGDSRCPADVQCVWEGNAEISVVIGMAGAATSTLMLNTNPTFATSADYLGFTVSLVALDPYPRTDLATTEPYRATLLVEPNDGP